jgi:cyclophilin family peptidyl-prolyl cis-trans isomerase
MKKFRRQSRLTKRRRRQQSRRTFLQLEALEPRLLLHGSFDLPHGHAPEHNLSEHIHADLSIYVNGLKEEIPSGVGVDTGGIISFSHTHSDDEQLHMHPVDIAGDSALENPPDFLTVGDFFETWRTNAGTPGNRADALFDETRIFNNVVDDTHALRMYVNGFQVSSYEDYTIHDQDQIVIAYGSAPVVTLKTNQGNIVMEMLPANAPATVANFLNYVNDGDYTNSIVHRSVPGFVIQGGGFTTGSLTFSGIGQFSSVPTDAPITNNFGLSNTRGTVAMARSSDVNSATSQWFVNLTDNLFLDSDNEGFTVFARVLDMASVDAIAAIPRLDLGGDVFNNLPVVTTGSQLVVVQAVAGDGIVQGTVFDDIDDSGSQDGGELGLVGFTVYADQDGDQQLDDNEIRTLTAADGSYQLRLPNGLQTIRQELIAPYRQGTPVPPAGRSVTVELGGTHSGVDFANTVVSSPGTPDLVAAFDTGSDSADDITSNNNSSAGTVLQFTVGNVIDGALVRLLAGNQEIGQTVASGNQVTITTTGAVGLLDGVNSIKAIQVVDGGDSLPGGTLAVTVDTAVDAFNSTPPPTATIGTAFSYDVSNPEEGDTGFTYSLSNALGGMAINASNGVISWLPVANQLGNQQFSVVATDAAGNQGTQDISLLVDGEVLVEFTVELTDTQGSAITSVAAGDQFLVRVLVEDKRSQPRGVFAAYTDVTFDTSLASVSSYLITVPTDGATEISDGETLTFDHPGPDGIGGNSDDIQYVLEFDKDSSVSGTNVAIAIVDGETSTQVASTIADVINNDAGSANAALGFDLNLSGDGELHVFANNSTTLTISTGSNVELSSFTYGPEYPNGPYGQVGIGNGVLDEVGAFSGGNELGGGQFHLFSIPVRAEKGGNLVFQADPADNLPSFDTLLYGAIVANAANIIYGSDSLTVTLDFAAANDTVLFNEDTTNNSIFVMANDSISGGSSVKITSVGQPNNGGSVSIASDELSLVYTPAADFFGLDIFTYTIGDDTGDSAATVSVQVFPQNDDPTVNNDTFDVDEDSSNILLDLLANDSILPDVGETLQITSTGTPSAGGTVTIASNGSHVLYTPLVNFDGQETFSYTISDGNGGTDTGTVTVDLQASGDNPLAKFDTLTVNEDSTDNSLDVLANDTSPDSNAELLITAVGTPSEGGIATVAGDQKSILYSPAPDFFGSEFFTYTISAGSSGSDDAVVFMTVTDLADPPTANDDIFQVVVDSPGEDLDLLANDTSAPDAAEPLTITAVTTTAQGGTVTIEQNGTLVQYIPPTGFLGQDSFSYTITDDDSLTGQAQVTVNVDSFQPGDISGTVFIDIDGDGIQDASEMVLQGITISLVGTDFESNAVQLTRITDSSGNYFFENLSPGSYVLSETQPAYLLDGLETVDSAAGTVTGDNEITIQLVEGADLVGTNFAERGRKAAMLSLADFFSARPSPSLLVCSGTDAGFGWVALDPSWTGFESVDASLAAGNTAVDIVVVDAGQSQQVTVDIGGNDPARTLYQDQANQLLGIIGTPDLLGIQDNPSGGDEADGESVSEEAIVDEAFADWNTGEERGTADELEEISWQENSRSQNLETVDLLLENWFAG